MPSRRVAGEQARHFYMLSRLVVKPDEEERLECMRIKHKNRIYGDEDLALQNVPDVAKRCW